MADVTVFTAARMLLIEAMAIVNGSVDAAGDLTLTRHNGETIDAGNIKGPKGDKGDPGDINVSPAGGDLDGSYPDPIIRALAVATGKIANLAVTTGKLADGAVTRAKLASGLAVPLGGSTSQILKKASNADGDTVWATAGSFPVDVSAKHVNVSTGGSGLSNNQVNVPHGLGSTPNIVFATVISHVGNPMMCLSPDTGYTSTHAAVYLYDLVTGAPVGSGTTRSIITVAIP